MSYEKQTWKTGDVITQEKLNHMEDGIASSGGSDSDVFLVKVTPSDANHAFTATADKTLQEVGEAFLNKKLVMTNDGFVFIGGGSADFFRTYVSGTVLVFNKYTYYMDEDDDDPSPDETRLVFTTEVFQLQPLNAEETLG